MHTVQPRTNTVTLSDRMSDLRESNLLEYLINMHIEYECASCQDAECCAWAATTSTLYHAAAVQTACPLQFVLPRGLNDASQSQMF